MAQSINKVMILGNLGADPEFRTFDNGDRICNLSVATNTSWREPHGEAWHEKTEWHRVVVFNEGLVNVVQQYLKKGAQVYIEGQLNTRKWKDEQSGQDKYSTEVVIQGFNSSLTMLGGGNSNNIPSQEISKSTESGSQSIPNDLDDDIPF